MKSEKPLSEKHQRFVRFYLLGESATAAYALAYGIENTTSTRAAACRLMKDARIIAAIEEGEETRARAGQPRQRKIIRNAARAAAVAPVKEIVNILPKVEPLTFANNSASSLDLEKLAEDSNLLAEPSALNLTKYDQTEERPDVSEIERRFRQQIGEPANSPLIFNPPNYQRPNAPTDQEALRRRLRSQAANGFGFMNSQKEK